MFCALLRPRYQVSVYRTIGPLVYSSCCMYELKTFCILVFFFVFLFHYNKAKLFSTDTLADLSLR